MAPDRDPTFVWLEMNWSMLSDAVQAYLRGSTTDQASIERLYRSWRQLVDAARAYDTRLPPAARDAVLGWAGSLGRRLPFPVQKVADQLEAAAATLSLLRRMRNG